MNRTLPAIVAGLTAATLIAGTVPAQAAPAACVRRHDTQILLMGKARTEVYVDTWATKCAKTTTVEGVSLTSPKTITVTGVELWRYLYEGSKGGVKSLTVKPPAASVGVPVWIGRSIPRKQRGYDGFVRLRVTVSGETRTINSMI